MFAGVLSFVLLICPSCLLYDVGCSYSRLGSSTCKKCYHYTKVPSFLNYFSSIFTSLSSCPLKYILHICFWIVKMAVLIRLSKTFSDSHCLRKSLTFKLFFFFFILFFKFSISLVWSKYIGHIHWSMWTFSSAKKKIPNNSVNASFSYKMNFLPFILFKVYFRWHYV